MSNVGKVFNLSGGGGSGSPKMESLTIATPPNKTVYKSGETFDPTGMVVVANYGEGLMANVTGYTVSPSVLTDGVSEVVITYTEGRITKTATVAVTVEKVLVSIAITTQPTKTVYQYQESLDSAGMVVTATFSDGSTAAVLDYTYPTTNFSTLGRQVMKLEYTYEGVTKSTDLVVTVQGKTIAVPTQTNIPTYNGSDKTPSWNGYDPLKMEISGVTSASDAGSYTAIFKLSYGYLFPDGTDEARVKWTIDRAVISALPTQTGTLVADGTSKTPSWNGYDTNKMTIGGDTSGTAAGEYTATFTPTSNYKWSDGSTGGKTASWTIGKATNSVTNSPSSIVLKSSAKTATFTVNRKGNGTITATSNNTSVAKIKSINQSTGVVTVESVNDTTGTAKITVKVAEGTNYKAASDTTVSVTATFREYLYGFDLTIADSNPATRVTYPSDVENSGFAKAVMNFGGAFSYGSWPSTPGEKFMPRPCMLRFNGTVDYYLNPNDYTKKADGTTSDVANMNYGGNAMMEWPKIYVKRWESNGVYHFRCSDMKVDSDYECWSNYDKNNKEIPHFYTPIFFGSKDGSNRLRSISGQSNFVSNTAQTEVTYAKNNGADIWYTEVLSDRELVNDLLTMMFKSTDLQATAGYGVCSASAAIAPGSMNTKGLFWGAGGKTSGVKVFGMENWWGNIFRRIAGWCISGGTQKVKLTRGTKDGTTVGDYNFDGNGYKTISGVNLTRSGYISKMKTESFGRFPMEANGSTTTFEADQVWADSGNGYYAFVGGRWNNDLEPSRTNSSIGAALSCKPLAAA